jgi:hypothetical protein
MKSKYKGYAWLLGEAVVVVLGVLIALAVDRAAQSIDRDALETTQLRGLVRDFQDADSVAEGARLSAEWRDGLGRELLLVLGGADAGDLDAAGLARAIEFPGWHYMPPFPRETWEDLVGTGELGAIRDPEVRRAVSQFYRYVEQLRMFNAEWVRISRSYRDDVRLILPAASRLALTKEFMGGDSVLVSDLPPVDELVRRVRGWPDLEGHLSEVLLSNAAATNLYTDLRREARDVLQLLEARLDAS